MRFALAGAAAGLSLAVVTVLLLGSSETSAQATTSLEVGDFYFCSASFQGGVCETTVTEGDSVEWQFLGSIVHTTTACADDHDSCSAPHLWDSPVMSSGSFSHTFDTPGTYLYRCQVHPADMRGQITVLAAAEPSPTTSSPPEATTPAETPAATATPRIAVEDVAAVPTGGGPPSGADGAPWLAVIVGGGLLLGALAAVGLRRRSV